jgi:hypothetical protein
MLLRSRAGSRMQGRDRFGCHSCPPTLFVAANRLGITLPQQALSGWNARPPHLHDNASALSRPQNDVKLGKEKVRRKHAIVLRQEEELQQREQALNSALRELQSLTQVGCHQGPRGVAKGAEQQQTKTVCGGRAPTAGGQDLAARGQQGDQEGTKLSTYF